MVELSPGDFLYQSDQELFLVVTGEEENHYTFAVHGWRDIDKERLEEYIEHSQSKVHKQETIEEIVREKGSSDTVEDFNKLKQLFSVYEEADIPKHGPHRDFTLDDR